MADLYRALGVLGLGAATIITGGLSVGALAAAYAADSGFDVSQAFWSGATVGALFGTFMTPYAVGRAVA